MSNKAAFAEAVLLNQDAIIELYVLDASGLGGEILRFVPAVQSDGQTAIMWQGVEYTAFPVEAKGYDIKGQGQLPRPTIAFANVYGSFSALCLNFNDLIGAKITRKRTFRKFLDGMPDEDPTAFFPDDIFYIDQKKEENHIQIAFELASAMDVDDVSLPRRKIIANLCPWIYRSSECSFAIDTVVADQTDTDIPSDVRTARGLYDVGNSYVYGDYTYTVKAGVKRYFFCKVPGPITGIAFAPPNTTYWTPDECAKRVVSCQKRFSGRGGGLPYGGFPGVQRLPF